VDLSAYEPGQEVTRGTVYRRIPNWEGFFDYEEDVPDLAVFTPRPQDQGALSAHLDQNEVLKALASPRHAGFGLLRLDIETMKRETAGRIRVEFDPRGLGSRSHVRIHGCTDDEIRALLANLAEVVHPPEQPSK